MPRIDTKTFYAAALSKHGVSPRALHWNSQESQHARFEILSSFLPDGVGALSVVDAGCGFADLYLYLEKAQRAPAQYVGLELMEEMCEEARQRTGCEIIRCDVLHDSLPTADYYLCSGAMNILTRFETHLFIRRCFDAAKKGFVFNLLEGKDASMVYNYFQPDEMIALGKELGAKKVEVRRGYLPHDFTVFFEKEQPVMKAEA